MRNIVLFFLVVSSFCGYAQQRYRFSVGGGFYSIMYWGLNDLKDVQSPGGPDYYQVYEHEAYLLNYRNFEFSGLYKINFGVNWISQPGFELHQSFSFFKGKFADEIHLTLTEANGVIDDYYYPDTSYSPANVYTGIQGTLMKKGKLGGIGTEVLLRSTLTKNVWWGIGTGVAYFGSSDEGYEWEKTDGYSVLSGLGRGRHNYITTQLFLSAEIRYRLNVVDFYFRTTQHIVTLKNQKGIAGWGNYTVSPTSHNFDYRFPLTIETGIAVSFDRIRKEN